MSSGIPLHWGPEDTHTHTHTYTHTHIGVLMDTHTHISVLMDTHTDTHTHTHTYTHTQTHTHTHTHNHIPNSITIFCSTKKCLMLHRRTVCCPIMMMKHEATPAKYHK